VCLFFLTSNGFSTAAALWVSVGLGVTYLVMMFVGLSIVDRIGRRRLTLTMIPGAALALGVLGTLWVTGHHGRDTIAFIIACLIVFMFFNAGGLQLMGWLTGSEIYPLAVRGAGTSTQKAAAYGPLVRVVGISAARQADGKTAHPSGEAAAGAGRTRKGGESRRRCARVTEEIASSHSPRLAGGSPLPPPASRGLCGRLFQCDCIDRSFAGWQGVRSRGVSVMASAPPRRPWHGWRFPLQTLI